MRTSATRTSRAALTDQVALAAALPHLTDLRQLDRSDPVVRLLDRPGCTASRACRQAPAEETERRWPARRAAASARRRSTATRRRRGPSRADQFLELVAEQPGITVAEAAERLGTSRNTLYNHTARLQREGRLRKDGSGFYPAEQATAEEAPEPPPASAS